MLLFKWSDVIQEEEKAAKYIVVLVDGYTGRVAGDLSVRQDAVYGDAGLGGPGQRRRQGKRIGCLCPRGHNLTPRAHLEGGQNKAGSQA